MRGILCVAVIVAITPSWNGALALTQNAEITWENETYRIRIVGGVITSLFDKSCQRELIVDQPTRGMFRVVLTRGPKKVHELDSSQMRLTESMFEDGAQRLTYESEQLRAVVRLQSGTDLPSVVCHIEAQPRGSDLAVAQVAFPVLQMRAPLSGNAAEDRIVFPLFEGRQIHDPLRGGTVKQVSRAFAYPGDMVAQFIGYFSNQAGCLLWTDDPDGHVKWFGFERAANEDGLVFFVNHRMPFAPGEAWRMPYQVCISSFSGTWQAGAEIYRAWAEQQFWCHTLLKDRVDLSPLLRQPSLVISSNLREENLEELPDLLAEYARRLGTRVLYRPVGWEKHGAWAGLDYFPPFLGDAEFTALVHALRKRGIATSCFLSGHRWSLQHEGAPQEVNAALKKYFEDHNGEAVVELRADGTIWSSVIPVGLLKARVCSGTPFATQHMLEEIRRLLDYGVAVVHWDQDHGPQPSGETCYNTAHGHPVPCGNWASQSMFNIMVAMKQEGKARFPEFFLSKESLTERVIPVLDAYQARYFQRLMGYYGDHPMEIVPVTQFIYHHYIPCIFGFTTFSPPEVARAIVFGQIPSVAFWKGPVAPVGTVNQDGVALLADYYAAINAYARPYLLYGRMMAEMAGVDVPTVRRKVVRPDKNLSLILDDPVVLVSAWSDNAGGFAVFAINPTSSPVSLRCVAPPSPTRHLTLSRFVGGEAIQPPQPITPGASFEWTLPPLRLCGLVYQVSTAQPVER